MNITYGKGTTKYGPRTITVNGELCERGEIYVDPNSFVITPEGKRMDGRSKPTRAPRPVVAEEPAKVQLAQAYIIASDFEKSNVVKTFPVGTILHRQSTGQYAPEGSILGQYCVSHYDAIREISVPVG